LIRFISNHNQLYMGCYCDRRKGGAGKSNTPYTWHLYVCEYMLIDVEGYSYEQFKVDYKEQEDKGLSSLELYNHFMDLHPSYEENQGGH